MTENQKINIKVQTNKLFGIDLVYFKTFASSIVILFAFILTSLVVVYPKIQELGEVSAKIDSTQKQIATVNTKANYLNSVDQDKLRQNEALIAQAIPDTKDLYFLLNVVGEITRKFDYVVESFSVSPGDLVLDAPEGSAPQKAPPTSKTPTKSGISNVPLSVAVLGPRSKYLELIKAIEMALPVMSIDKFSMEADNDDQVILKMVVSTYSLPRVQTAPKDGALADLQLTKTEMELLNTISEFTRVDIESLTATPSADSASNTGRSDPFNF